MDKNYVHLNELVNSGELGTTSYWTVKKFITHGIRGKKLEAKIMPSIFGNEAPRGQRFIIEKKAITAFKKHLGI